MVLAMLTPKKPPQRSSLGLIVLWQLTDGPMHVYRMQKLFEAQGKDRVVNVRSRASLYQAIRLSRQETNLKLLRGRLKGAREDIVVAQGLQSHFDEVVQHLESSPQEAISLLQKKLTDTEQRAAVQKSRLV